MNRETEEKELKHFLKNHVNFLSDIFLCQQYIYQFLFDLHQPMWKQENLS